MPDITFTFLIYFFIQWWRGASKQNSYELYLLTQFKLESRYHLVTLISFQTLSFMEHKKRSFAECPCCSFQYNQSGWWSEAVKLQKRPNSIQSTQRSHYFKSSEALVCKKDWKLSCYSLNTIVMITIHFYCIEITNLDILLQTTHFTFCGLNGFQKIC